MIQDALRKLTSGGTLTQDEAAGVAEEIMTGEAAPSQIGAFLVALRMKGESVDEITGMARVMRAKALRVPTDSDLVDVVGTGGDGMSTFNISTASALTTAAVGVRVAKHGNRAASGTVGAADILEAQWREARAQSGVGEAVHRRGGHRVHVCAGVPPCHALRRPCPAGAGRTHGVQRTRAADEPRRGRPPAAGRAAGRGRRRASGARRDDGPRLGRAGERAIPGLSVETTAWTSSRRQPSRRCGR